MQRVIEQSLDGRPLDDASTVHHQNPVTQLGNHAQIMGDKDDRHAGFLLQLFQQVQDLSLDGDIQRGGRLVCDQDLRLAQQRDRDHHALTHPTRQLMRVFFHASLGSRYPHPLQHLDRGPVDIILAHLRIMQGQRLSQLSAYAIHRIECRHRLLKDHRDTVATDVVHILGRQPHQILSPKPHLAVYDTAGRPWQQTHDRQRADALATAGFTDYAQRLTCMQLKADVIQRPRHTLLGIEFGGQVADLKQ